MEYKTCNKCGYSCPIYRFRVTKCYISNVCTSCTNFKNSNTSFIEYENSENEFLSIVQKLEINKFAQNAQKRSYVCNCCTSSSKRFKSRYCNECSKDMRYLTTMLHRNLEIINLNDNYVIQNIQLSTKLTRNNISKEMIKVKKNQLKLKRYVKKQNKRNTAKC